MREEPAQGLIFFEEGVKDLHPQFSVVVVGAVGDLRRHERGVDGQCQRDRVGVAPCG